MMFSVTRTLLPRRLLSGDMRLGLGLKQKHMQFSTITTALIKDLRARSGAPMMDCKKALVAEEGSIEKAMMWLRSKGITKLSDSAGREAKEGLIVAKTHSGFTALLEINSETDFVSRNQDFQIFAAKVMSSIGENFSGVNGDISIDALSESPMVGDEASNQSLSVQDALGDLASRIRENIVIRRAVNIVCPSGHINTTYMHGRIIADKETIPSDVQMGKDVAVLTCSLSEQSPAVLEASRKLAMHTVAAKPKYLSTNDIPVEVIEMETKIFEEQMEDDTKAKSPEIKQRILQGKLQKRLNEMTLLGQNHVAEEGGPVVSKYLESFSKKNSVDFGVSSFVLWQLGSKQ